METDGGEDDAADVTCDSKSWLSNGNDVAEPPPIVIVSLAHVKHFAGLLQVISEYSSSSVSPS